ncbi:IQ domain-containing protein H-like [Sycon ciliatum]|uniref:IQ domain-containing protein H-like n=1 Tax=Sycon ciliatum TaxID=27933 RepID=UPI0031F69806
MDASPGEAGGAAAATAILKVQEELGVLRGKLSQLVDSSARGVTVAPISLKQLEDVMQQVEENIDREAERLVHSEHGQVTTLPPIGTLRSLTAAERTHTSRDDHDLAPRPRLRRSDVAASKSSGSLDISPGQSLKKERARRALRKPTSNYNRTAVKETFGDLFPQTTAVKHEKPRKLTKFHTGPLPSIAKQNRKDAQIPPPPITKEDARRGVLSLLERGLIPPATQIDMDPPLFQHKQLQLAAAEERTQKGNVMDEQQASAGGTFVTGVKMKRNVTFPTEPIFDSVDDGHYPLAGDTAEHLVEQRVEDMQLVPVEDKTVAIPTLKSESTSHTRPVRQSHAAAAGQGRERLPMATQQISLQPVDQLDDARDDQIAALAGNLQDALRRVRKFTIQHGVTVKTSQEFLEFREMYLSRWGSVLSLLRHFELLLAKFSVPLVFVDPDRFACLALEYQMEERPQPPEYLACCLNSDDVYQYFYNPKFLFKSARGRGLAAARIQATWRMYVARCQWREYRRRKWAAGVFCMAWMLKMRQKKKLKDRLSAQEHILEEYYKRQTKLREKWDSLQTRFHKVVHIPSLGYSHDLRQTMNEFNLAQNLQIGRLAEVAERNIEVIYLSPMDVDQNMKDYSMNILKAATLFEEHLIKQYDPDTDPTNTQQSEEDRNAQQNGDENDSTPRQSESSETTDVHGETNQDDGDENDEQEEERKPVKRHKPGPADAMFHFARDEITRPPPSVTDTIATVPATTGLFKSVETRIRSTVDEDEKSDDSSLGPWDFVQPTVKTKSDRNLMQKTWDRFSVIVPSNLKAFEMNNFPLSMSVMYSAFTMRRLQLLTGSFEAYIVPGVPCMADVHLSEVLKLPVLAPEPSMVLQYNSKSGGRTLFEYASVAVAPGDKNIYTEHQLAKSLARLVVQNPFVTRWLVKINDEVQARGIAYLDLPGNLPSYAWLVQEARRFGDKWSRPWAQEQALNRLDMEVSDLLSLHLKPVSQAIYPDFNSFIAALSVRGGVIEATPTSSTVTTVTADMLLTPTGLVEIHCTTDQILSAPYVCTGYSLPQTSIAPHTLYTLCMCVGEALLRQKGMMGYVSVDFVTSVDQDTDEQVIWGTDLKFHYGNSLSLSKLAMAMSATVFNPRTGCLRLKKPAPVKRDVFGPTAVDQGNIMLVPSDTTPMRYVVMSNLLRNSNMVLTQYSVFFQMCKGHRIGYKVEQGTGTVLQLTDSVKRHAMGMICIDETLPGALKMFTSNLSTIHQEIAPRGRDGRQNFTAMINALEAIISETDANEAEEHGAEEHD